MLKQLEQQLQTSERVAISTLTGMGGIGKTELALQYALKDINKSPEMRHYQGGICWLNGRGETIGIQLLRFIENYLQITMPDEGTLEERVAIGWQRWTEGESLIIFDDVEEIKQIEPYLPPQVPPPNKRFKVIITTRNQRISRNFALFAVELLTLDDSIKLLASFIEENTINQDKSGAEALCKWLGCLPLAIELVGRYIRETKEDIATVLESLKALKLDDESLAYPTDEIMTAKRGVAAAFQLSWQQLSESGQIFGMSLSLFALAPIPAEMFLQDGNNRKQTEKDLRNLKNLSLINDIGHKIYEIHPLIWQYLRAKLDESTEAESLKRHHCQLMTIIARQISEEITQADIEAFNPAIPHLALTAEELHPWLTDDDLIAPYITLGTFYIGQGLYKEAQPWHEDCLSIAQSRLGAEHPDVAQSLNNLAELYRLQGKYDAAEPLHLQALEMNQKLFGNEHPDVAQSMNNLGLLYHAQGEYDAAEPLFLRVLEMQKKLFGNEHRFVATTLNNLGLLYHAQRRYDAAEPLYLKALEMSQKFMGHEHRDVANTLNNLSALYYSQGNYKKAEPLLKQALEMAKKILGKEHPNVIFSVNNLAFLYHSQEKNDAAESLFLEALDIRKKILENDHPDIAISLYNLAGLYNFQKKYTDAIPLFQQAIAIFRQRLGDNHPTTEECNSHYLTMLLEAPEQEIFPLISPKEQQKVLIIKKTFKINNTNYPIKKSKKKPRKKDKGFGS